MQTTFGVNVVALIDKVPQTLSLLCDLIRHYVSQQREVVTRRIQYSCARPRPARTSSRAADRARQPRRGDRADPRLRRRRRGPRRGLMEKFSLTPEIQAQAILDMRLQRLTALESEKVRAEHAELMARIRELREILGDEEKIDALIRDELATLGERYGDDRRTEITYAEGEIDIEDLIADQQMVVSLTASGYAKRLPLATYRQQPPRRQGRDRDGPQGRRLHRASSDICSTLTTSCCSSPTAARSTGSSGSWLADGGLADAPRQGVGLNAAAERRRAGDGGDPESRHFSQAVLRLATAKGQIKKHYRVPSPTTLRSAPTASSRSRSAPATNWSR